MTARVRHGVLSWSPGPGRHCEGVAFGGAIIWNSGNWRLLVNWHLHCRTGWFVSAAAYAAERWDSNT